MLKFIVDKYTCRIERLIARGGMGSVYEAVQLGTCGFEKRVAIKTLLPRFSKNNNFIELFIDEGKLVADLVHENIVQIYQLGQNNDEYYIVMEYVHGLTLQQFIHYHSIEQIPLPRELAVFITSRIARGLAYAHSRRDHNGKPLNIVHRDVCPSNIMITTEGLPKLGDFGIAKAANNTVAPSDSSLVGKLMYMSPEQARRTAVDHRSDMYSLGLILFELLAMTKARGKFKDSALIAAHKGELDWDALPQDINPDLKSILTKLVSTDRDKRYEDSDQVAYELEFFIYKKGYGPTVVTLQNYLNENFPHLFLPVASTPESLENRRMPSSNTMAMDDS